MILAATGHWPDKLGGYEDEATNKLIAFGRKVLTFMKPDAVISGMALGWDQAIAQAAYQVRIPFYAYIPFEGQETMWPHASQARYKWLRSLAALEVIVCEPGYSREKMFFRNRAMVDRCDSVLALWNGSTGGTAHCITYAIRRRKAVHNVWNLWVEF